MGRKQYVALVLSREIVKVGHKPAFIRKSQYKISVLTNC